MQHSIKSYLKDIELSIQEIYEFVPQPRTYAAFQNDLKTKKAVERNIEIIGEAMDRILKLAPEIQITDSRKIVDTRNRIIHGYDSVSADVLWLIVINYLPLLEKEVKAYLNSDFSG